MYISSRLLKVIDFLKNHKETTIRDIAQGCDITERMVRYDIENLNFLLRVNNISQIEKMPKGILSVPEGFIQSEKVNDFKDLNKYSKYERVEYIKAKLLIEGRINLSAIAKELDVSRTSIRSDVAQVIKDVESNDLKVVNNEVVSDERSVRHTITKHFSKELLKFQSKSFGEKEENLLENFISELIIDISQKNLRDIIEAIAKDMENENINYFSPVWLNIIITYIRLNNGNVRENLREDIILKNKSAYKILTNYIEKIEEILGIKYPETEVLGLAKCIEGCMSNKINTYVMENWLDIVLIIKETINDASEYSGINLRNDEVLINGLLNHIKPAIYRIKKNINLELDICMDVVEPYMDLLKVVQKNFKPLENIIEAEITEYEIALITLHILASIERNKNREESIKKILLVCGGGYGTTSIVANRIKSDYKVKIVDMLSYSDFLQYDVSDIDCIITILKIEEEFFKGKKIIKISPFITEKDKGILEKYLPKHHYNKNKLDEILDIVNESTELQNKDELLNEIKQAFNEESLLPKENKTLRDYIDINKISVIDKVYSWQESIVRVGEILEKSGDIEREYINNIINVSENCGVYFVLNNQVVLPHGEVDDHVNKSAISVLLVKEPVKFPYDKTGKLFFMIAAKTTKDHVKSIEEISNLCNNLKFIKDLDNINKEEELMNLILDCIQ